MSRSRCKQVIDIILHISWRWLSIRLLRSSHYLFVYFYVTLPGDDFLPTCLNSFPIHFPSSIPRATPILVVIPQLLNPPPFPAIIPLPFSSSAPFCQIPLSFTPLFGRDCPLLSSPNLPSLPTFSPHCFPIASHPLFFPSFTRFH